MPSRPGGRTIKAAGKNVERDVDAARQPDRITIGLIPKAGDDLQRLQDRTSLSKTDLVNRAITLYEFIDERTRTGQEIVLRDRETGETQTVVLL